jgi:hypothetical protein
MDMDPAVAQAIKRIDESLVRISGDLHEQREDFILHVREDKAVWDKVRNWEGALKLLAWCSPATLIAVVVLVIRGWKL